MLARCCGCLFGKRRGGESTFELGVLDSPLVSLDRSGAEVRLESSATGCAVWGNGSAYASTPIEQDAAYWEVHVESTGGTFRVGVCREAEADALPSELGDEKSSWALKSEDAGAVEGDVIGVAFGQAELPNLSFFLNGELLDHAQVNRIRGEVFPAASVAGGARLRCVRLQRRFSDPTDLQKSNETPKKSMARKSPT